MQITGNQLKKFLKTKEITQEEASLSLKVSRQTVNNWCKLAFLDETILQIVKTSFPEFISEFNAKSPILTDNNGDYQLSDKNTFVSLLPLSAQAGTLNDFIVGVKESECEKIISPIEGVDFAITVSGESMSPEYPSGTQVFIKKINEKAFIDWGRTYVLDTCNGIVLKRIVPGSADGYVKCLSINPDPVFAPFEVSLKDVFGIYRVLLSMSIK